MMLQDWKEIPGSKVCAKQASDTVMLPGIALCLAQVGGPQRAVLSGLSLSRSAQGYNPFLSGHPLPAPAQTW